MREPVVTEVTSMLRYTLQSPVLGRHRCEENELSSDALSVAVMKCARKSEYGAWSPGAGHPIGIASTPASSRQRRIGGAWRDTERPRGAEQDYYESRRDRIAVLDVETVAPSIACCGNNHDVSAA